MFRTNVTFPNVENEKRRQHDTASRIHRSEPAHSSDKPSLAIYHGQSKTEPQLRYSQQIHQKFDRQPLDRCRGREIICSTKKNVAIGNNGQSSAYYEKKVGHFEYVKLSKNHSPDLRNKSNNGPTQSIQCNSKLGVKSDEISRVKQIDRAEPQEMAQIFDSMLKFKTDPNPFSAANTAKVCTNYHPYSHFLYFTWAG